MANIDNPNGFRLWKSLAGEVVLWKGYLAASETIAKGDAVIEATGRVEIGLSSSGTLLGVAAQGCTASTKEDPLMFYPAVPWYVFEGQCSGTYDRDMMFTSVDIEGATSIMEVNEDATTEKVIRLVGEDPNSEIGANTRVLFIVERSGFVNLQDAE